MKVKYRLLLSALLFVPVTRGLGLELDELKKLDNDLKRRIDDLNARFKPKTKADETKADPIQQDSTMYPRPMKIETFIQKETEANAEKMKVQREVLQELSERKKSDNKLKKVVPLENPLESLKKNEWANKIINQIKSGEKINDHEIDQFAKFVRAKIAYPDCNFNKEENKMTRISDEEEQEQILTSEDIDREFHKKARNENVIWETIIAPLFTELYMQNAQNGKDRSREAHIMYYKIMELENNAQTTAINAKIKAYLKTNELRKVVPVEKSSFVELLRKDEGVSKIIDQIKKGKKVSDQECNQLTQFVRTKIVYPDCSFNEKENKVTRILGGRERTLPFEDINREFINKKFKDDDTIWEMAIKPLLIALYKQDSKDDQDRSVEACAIYQKIMQEKPSLLRKRIIQTLVKYD
jgi:hypothetical protein